jgi:hypothetical protein
MANKTEKLDKYSDLHSILKQELPINGARIKFLVLFIGSLIKVQSVSYSLLAEGFDNPIELSSNMRRIQRFFAKFELNSDMISGFLFRLLPNHPTYALTLDRTNWRFGKTNINILMIGVICGGTSIPLCWTLLGNKCGNSNQKERIALIENFIRLFGADKIAYIVADREFMSRHWSQFLINKKIKFYFRIRANLVVTLKKELTVKASSLFKQLGLKTVLIMHKSVEITGCEVYLTGMKYKNSKGKVEFLIIASYERTKDAMACYKKRWQIETMFKALKTAGFNLESTHLTDYKRLNQLLMILAIAFAWAYKVGIYKNEEIKPIRIKNHGRPEYGFFKYGLKWLAQSFQLMKADLINFLAKLLVTPPILFVNPPMPIKT